MARALWIVLLSAWMTSCTAFQTDPNVFVASTPSGADIFVDGEKTGLTTPAALTLGGMLGGDHEITLVLPGHDPESRWVRHNGTTRTSRWGDGACPTVLSYTLPLYWTLGDWFLPFEYSARYTPHEIHAVLYPEGQGPVRSSAR